MANDDFSEVSTRFTQSKDDTVNQMDDWLERARKLSAKHTTNPSSEVIASLAVGMALAHELADIGSVLEWHLDEIQNAIGMK